MWIDVIIGLIILICLVLGFRRGFVKTIINTLGWLISIGGAFFLCDKLIEYVRVKTTAFLTVQMLIEQKLSQQAIGSVSQIMDKLPVVLRDHVNAGVEAATTSVAGTLADVTIKIAAFFAIILIIRIIFWTVEALLSRENTGGIIGALDGVTGAIIGLVEALVISYLLLMLLIPLSTTLNLEFIAQGINSSFAAKYLYDYNLLLMAIQSYFPG